MIRQRMHLRTRTLAYLTRALTLLLAAILIWYGAMIVLLAAKVAPHTVNSISAYRTIYDFLAKLRISDLSTRRRLVGGFGGLIAFLVLVYLALQELPRPYLTRHEKMLTVQEHGSLSIEPRAVERLAEIAASTNRDVSGFAARLDRNALTVSIGVRSARRLSDTLTDVRASVIAELARHELPRMTVNVTVTKFEPTTGRNLS